jgi:hypothetical protein
LVVLLNQCEYIVKPHSGGSESLKSAELAKVTINLFSSVWSDSELIMGLHITIKKPTETYTSQIFTKHKGINNDAFMVLNEYVAYSYPAAGILCIMNFL